MTRPADELVPAPQPSRWPWLAIAACLAVFLAALAVRVVPALHGQELHLARAMPGTREGWLTTIVDALESLLAPVLLLPIAMAVGLLAWLRSRRVRRHWGLALVQAAVTGAALPLLLKQLVRESRPALSLQTVHETDFGLPSGHACGAMVLATFAFLRLGGDGPAWTAARWLALTLGLLVAVGRVYQDAHFASDVVAGGALGVACAVAAVVRSPRRTS